MIRALAGTFGRIAAAGLVTVTLGLGHAMAAGEVEAPIDLAWDFEGPFGTFDENQLKRGLMVYEQVCHACHSLKYVAYRNLGDENGPDFTEAEVKAIAAKYQVTDGPDEFGEMYERAARPSDTFVAPFPNEQAARAANNGAYPPDLSLMTKARKNGPDYLYSLLVGYEDPPADVTLRAGMSYNPYFSGHQIAMPPPLYEEAVEYADGTPATVDQMAQDVVTFLMWTAEPTLVERKQIGLQVMIFLIVLTGLLYFTYRKVWRDVEH